MSKFYLASLLLFFSFFGAFESFAAENQYLVEGIEIEARGQTPADAKNKAQNIARREAFKTLATRLELPQDAADKVTDEEVTTMVRSETIEQEKIAGSNYFATMKFLFARDFVSHILAKKKIRISGKNSAKENIEPQLSLAAKSTTANQILSSARLEIKISGFDDWILIRNKIEQDSAIEVQLQSIATDKIVYLVKYNSSNLYFPSFLSKINLVVESADKNNYVTSISR